MNKYLQDYSIGVQAVGVSGFEYLNTLMARDQLFTHYDPLTPTEKEELLKADYVLLQHSAEFRLSLEQITTFEYERQHRQVSPLQWWWYVDVVTHLPILMEWPVSRQIVAIA